MRKHLTPSLVLSLAAIFIALGGTSYAISQLPKNSVGTAQIKKSAVDSTRVKDRSLLAKDFKSGQLPAGAKGVTGPAGAPGTDGQTGPTGPTGITGAAGSALAYAYVQDVGNPSQFIPTEKAKSMSSSMVTRASTGTYCFDLESIWPVHNVTATAEPSYGNPGASDKYAMAQILHNSDFGVGCPNTSDMVVVVRDESDAAPVNWFFYVSLN